MAEQSSQRSNTEKVLRAFSIGFGISREGLESYYPAPGDAEILDRHQVTYALGSDIGLPYKDRKVDEEVSELVLSVVQTNRPAVTKNTHTHQSLVIFLSTVGGFARKPLQLWHKPSTFEGLARPRPSFALQTLDSRDHEGNFTGKKDLLPQSGAYTVQFGSAVPSIFSTLR